jgi:hypothetical protein
MTDLIDLEITRARRFGWTSLTLWALLGLALEAAHGWKLSSYLDDELARSLLRLAHAHGVLLACVSLLYASQGQPLLAARADAGQSVGRLLRVAGVAMPFGFAMSVIGHGESDPGAAIFLVPLGALALIVALVQLSLASFRKAG